MRWRSGRQSRGAEALGDEFLIEREMGCTRREFLNWLPGACAGASHAIEGDRIRILAHGGQVTIDLAERPPRLLGLLSLPVLHVAIRFDGMDQAGRAEFLRHFDLHTRRGGG